MAEETVSLVESMNQERDAKIAARKLNLHLDVNCEGVPSTSGKVGGGDPERRSADHLLTRSYSRWSPAEEGVTVAWRDLSVYAHANSSRGPSGLSTAGTARSGSGRVYQRIVNNVTGAVKAGSLVALMGSSGAGKSTLMAALAHRSPGGMVVEGDILINGRPVGDYMRTLSGFMHQDDIFVGSLTVLEHMTLMARLKLDRHLPEHDRLKTISTLLRNLGLSQSMHTRIGISGDTKVLSGGEKKRLAFATEMLTNPPLLFCDEPTTGLDSYSAQKLVKMMDMMANKGKTIICTIHQPSSELFAMFNQLILVADGRIAFMGSTDQALFFFEGLGYECPRNYNPADFFIRTLAITPGSEEASKASMKRICDQYVVSDAAKEIDFLVQYEFHMGISADQSSYHRNQNFKGPFWFMKLFWITYRTVLQVLRDPSVQGMRILQKMAIALMVGLCFIGSVTTSQSGIQSVQGALFILVAENTFGPMYSVLALFPKEFPLFIREYKSGLYSTSIYYVANMIAVFPGLIVEPVIFVCISYWLVGLRNSLYAFLMTMLTTVLTMNVSTACGIFFSAMFETPTMAMAFLVPFDYVLMITSGVFVSLGTLPSYISWTKYLSWLMYSNEAMSIVQWEGVQNITCDLTAPNMPCLNSGEQILEKYSFSKDHLTLDLMYIVMLYCIYHTLGFLFLLRRAKRN